MSHSRQSVQTHVEPLNAIVQQMYLEFPVSGRMLTLLVAKDLAQLTTLQAETGRVAVLTQAKDDQSLDQSYVGLSTRNTKSCGKDRQLRVQ